MDKSPPVLTRPTNPVVFIRSNDAENIRDTIIKIPGFETSNFDLGKSGDTNSVQQKLEHLPRQYKAKGLHRPFIALVCEDRELDLGALHDSNCETLSKATPGQRTGGYSCLYLKQDSKNQSINTTGRKSPTNPQDLQDCGQIFYTNTKGGVNYLLEGVRSFFSRLSKYVMKLPSKS